VSLPPLELTLPTDRLRVSPWFDPVDALAGHDLRSTYVERFWLPILGPTTTFLLRRLAAELDVHPDGFDLPVLDTAHALGLGVRGGRNAPFLRAIARATGFHMIRPVATDALEVRHRAPTLSRHQVARLPVAVRDAHDAWQAEAERVPDVDQLRRRARRLALSLVELGEPAEAVEQQLHRWRIHPALAHEGLQWALERRRSIPTEPDAGPDAAADGSGAPTGAPTAVAAAAADVVPDRTPAAAVAARSSSPLDAA
jgi:hypothetical protein